MIGVTLGGYEITEAISVGRTGSVWRAIDRLLDRPAAVKLLAPSQLARAAPLEALSRTLARLHHPNVAAPFQVVRDCGYVALVREFARGETFAELLAREPRLPRARAESIFAQVLAALAAAHCAGLAHGGVKLSNLVLGPSGSVKVLDFGIVADADPQADLRALAELELAAIHGKHH